MTRRTPNPAGWANRWSRWFAAPLLLTSCLSGTGVTAGEAPQQPPGASLPGVDSAPLPVASQQAFDIWEYQVTGNSVLASRVIEQTVYPYLGPKRSIDDVEKARQALAKAYEAAGFQTVLVDIPEQGVERGIVTLQVTEGSVDRMKITGSRYFSLGKIREGVPELAPGKVPHMPTVQQQLAQVAEESADRRVTPVLRAGRTPGTLEAELQVEDKLPLHGSLEMNGRNSFGTSYSRLIASVRYDNLWQLQHSASFQYQVAPEKQDVEVFAGTYVLPVPHTDLRLALYGVGIDSTSDVASGGALGVVGSGQIFGLRLVKPLPGVDRYFQSLSLGMDYKDFQQNIALLGGDEDNTPISYLPFSIRYDGSYRHGDSALTSLNLEGNFSIRGLGNDQQEFENRRVDATANYFYFSGELKHLQTLPYDFRLTGRVSGQVANSPLISNEQFAAGGDDSVRGYYEVQELGDSGLIASLEAETPYLLPDRLDSVQNLRFAAFIEGAKLWTMKTLADTPADTELASAGLGFRFQALTHVLGYFYWGHPFFRSGSVDPGNQRIHFRVAYEF